MASTTVFVARRVITVGPGPAEATALAVRDGRILAVGSPEDCLRWGPADIDDRWADAVIVPGFVEAHAHVAEGSVGTTVPYLTWFDRPLADGTVSPGVRSYAELVERLRAIDERMDERGEPDDAVLAVGGFDPIYFTGERRLDRHHLDAVGSRRPIYVQHANGHLATVNSRGLEHWRITADLTVDGIGRHPDGTPDGELREVAMSLARGAAARVVGGRVAPETIRLWAHAARRAGITTCTDLASAVGLAPGLEGVWREVTTEAGFPIRAVSYTIVNGVPGDADEFAAAFIDLRECEEHDRWRLAGVKIVLDGSIQGWTAAISWPGYFTGTGHPMLLVPVERMHQLLLAFHRARVNVHVHCNGDLAAEAVLDAIDVAVAAHPWLDHRHTITHAQTMTAAQVRRAARLGAGLNFFSNHLWYWGDQHAELTLGPDRAARLDPCGDAVEAGVPFALHSDAPVTPLGQLHTMWCAVNRLTPSGRVLGPEQRIGVTRALRAVTLDAAWLMHLDHEIGSIEVGKRADLTVLDDDPLAVDPLRLRDLTVLGTVVDGIAQPADAG